MRIDDPDPPATERRPIFRTDLRDVPRLTGGVAIVFVLVIGLAFFALCRSHNPEREGHLPIVVIPNAEVASLPTLTVPRLVLTGEREIVKGQFLTTKPGAHALKGFLLEALSPSRTTTGTGEPKTTVKTRPASLFEAVPAGSLVANPADFRPTRRLIGIEQVEQMGQVEHAPQPESIEDRVPAAFRPEVGMFSHLHPEFDCNDPTDPGDKSIPRWVKLRPIFKPKLKPVFNMRWNDEKWWRKRIETAEVGLRGKLRLGVRWSLPGSLDCTLKPALRLPLFVAAVPAGPVPVPLKVVATVQPTVNAKLATRLKGRVEVLMNGFAGAEYAGERIQPKGTVAPTVKAAFPTFEQEMSAGVGVTPAVVVQAGWGGPLGKLAATAELSFPTGVTVGFEPGPGVVPEACIPLSVKGTIRFHLPLKKDPYSVPSPKLKLFKKCRKLGGEESKDKPAHDLR